MTQFDFEFEKYSLSAQELKTLIHEEVELYHSEEKRNQYDKQKKEHPEGILAKRGVGKPRQVI